PERAAERVEELQGVGMVRPEDPPAAVQGLGAYTLGARQIMLLVQVARLSDQAAEGSRMVFAQGSPTEVQRFAKERIGIVGTVLIREDRGEVRHRLNRGLVPLAVNPSRGIERLAHERLALAQATHGAEQPSSGRERRDGVRVVAAQRAPTDIERLLQG